jgi:hypothetical protein
MNAPQPTPQDQHSARLRQEIAERQAREYEQVWNWARAAFGPGWLPSHRHFLVSKDEEEKARRSGESPAVAAVVYTVKSALGEQRHFTVEGGRVVEHASYEAGFGPMLLEPHPTRTIEVRGQQVHPHRYSLCWAAYELYQPRTAEQLAALRATRERKKAEREEQRWREENPLLAWAEAVKAREAASEEEGQGRSP